jgi:hypothetical protein
MTAALPFPPRVLALVGAGLLAVLALLVARPLLLSSESADADSTPVAAPTPAAPTPTPAAPSTPARPAVPAVQLVAGLPKPIAATLRRERVAVVALYTRTSPTDRGAVRDAKAGAQAAGAGFVAIDLLDERAARAFHPFGGAVDPPAILVVRRPGAIVTQLEGRVDSAVVQQAAHNAGARR